MPTYYRKLSALHLTDRDEIAVLFARPKRGRSLRMLDVTALCDVTYAGELIRIAVQDHKTLALGRRLAAFDPVPDPDIWSWGYIHYDPSARVAIFYLAPLKEEASLARIERRGICEVDDAGELIRLVIPVRGRQGTALLGAAAGHLPQKRR
ncbi:MAG: hypothetical protein Kow0047_08720 [Anaerolineae bacterium]